MKLNSKSGMFLEKHLSNVLAQMNGYGASSKLKEDLRGHKESWPREKGHNWGQNCRL